MAKAKKVERNALGIPICANCQEVLVEAGWISCLGEIICRACKQDEDAARDYW